MTQYFCALPLNLATNNNLVRQVKVRYQRLFKFDEGLEFWSPTLTPRPRSTVSSNQLFMKNKLDASYHRTKMQMMKIIPGNFYAGKKLLFLARFGESGHFRRRSWAFRDPTWPRRPNTFSTRPCCCPPVEWSLGWWIISVFFHSLRWMRAIHSVFHSFETSTAADYVGHHLLVYHLWARWLNVWFCWEPDYNWRFWLGLS